MIIKLAHVLFLVWAELSPEFIYDERWIMFDLGKELENRMGIWKFDMKYKFHVMRTTQ